MLVLTRKQQEQIQVGDNITVTIVRIQGNTVRIGINAPRSVRVVRGEVAMRDAEAASGAPRIVIEDDSESPASGSELPHETVEAVRPGPVEASLAPHSRPLLTACSA